MNPYMKQAPRKRGNMYKGGSVKKMKMAEGGEAKKKKKTSMTDVALAVGKPINEVAKFFNKNVTDKFLVSDHQKKGKEDSVQSARKQYQKNRKNWQESRIKKAGG